MLELESALRQILDLIPASAPEMTALAKSHGRFLAAEMPSPVDLPGFDNSAMDGYAVRSAEVSTADANTPVTLKLLGRVAAGEIYEGEVSAGGCVRLFTGSPLPRGADAVVMQEDTRVDPGQPGVVSFLDACKPWENIRFRGEDVKQGALLGKPGDELTASRIQLFAAAGIASFAVGRRPVCGLLATGSELLESGSPAAPGKIFESNRAGLAVLAERTGAVTRIYPLVQDTLGDTVQALETALAECDIVITSGGVSVGEMDFTKAAFARLGGELEFWKIAIRPGRPFAFGRHRNKFLFGLPGNPVSAFITFLLLVRPALRRWQGAANDQPHRACGVLAEPLFNPHERRHFVRVILDAEGRVRSAGAQASHVLFSLAAANGLVDVPPRSTLPAGSQVPVIGWD
jgi:molybdopterin molybdotransferase